MTDLRRISKIELHCHLDGIVDPAMIREMAAEGPAPPVSAEALEACLPVRTRRDFWRYMTAAEPFEGSLDRFRPVWKRHVARLKAQSVVYAEIMVGTSEIPRDPMEAVAKLREFRAWLDGECGSGLRVEILAAVGREAPPPKAESWADRAIALHAAGLVAGAAVAGYEDAVPTVKGLARPLARLREAGVPFEIHAGEWAGPDSVRDALDHGARRIGHGVAAFRDEGLLRRIADERVHVEMCPSSNVATGAVDRIEDHPIARAMELGIPVSVNTDDPGAFGITMTSELELLSRVFGFGDAEFERIARDSREAAFGRG